MTTTLSEREKNNYHSMGMTALMWIGVFAALVFPGVWYGSLLINFISGMIVIALVAFSCELLAIFELSAKGEREAVANRLANVKIGERDAWVRWTSKATLVLCFLILFFFTDLVFSTTIVAMSIMITAFKPLVKKYILEPIKQENI